MISDDKMVKCKLSTCIDESCVVGRHSSTLCRMHHLVRNSNNVKNHRARLTLKQKECSHANTSDSMKKSRLRKRVAQRHN